jgi:hypothetical protein
MAWRHTLDLGDIPPSPAANLLSEDELSSCVDNVEEWYELKTKCDGILSQLQNNNVDTARFLNLLIEHLPKAGQMVLLKEILVLGFDVDKLTRLRNFFVDAILKPSKYSIMYITSCRNLTFICSESTTSSDFWHFGVATHRGPGRDRRDYAQPRILIAKRSAAAQRGLSSSRWLSMCRNPETGLQFGSSWPCESWWNVSDTNSMLPHIAVQA